jgi:hypothetical protein
MTIHTETNLIEALVNARNALSEERTRLLERVAVIDQALGASPSKSAPRVTKEPKGAKPPKIGGTKAAVLGVASVPSTLKEIVSALPQVPAKSVEAVVYALAKDGALSKDGSKPSKFSAVASA